MRFLMLQFLEYALIANLWLQIKETEVSQSLKVLLCHFLIFSFFQHFDGKIIDILSEIVGLYLKSV